MPRTTTVIFSDQFNIATKPKTILNDLNKLKYFYGKDTK